MTSQEFQDTQRDVEQYFSRVTPELIQHRARQRLFYTKCLRHLKQGNASWTLLLDTDEFVRLNYQLAEQYNMTKSSQVAPMTKPGSVATLLQQSTTFSTSPTENTPLFSLQSSPCVQIPRIRFVSTEENSTLSVHRTSSIDPNRFMTLRYRTHTNQGDLQRNKISKAILDLSRIHLEDILAVDSIHLPIRSLCQQRRLHTRKAQSLLVINHYMGNYEQYIYREMDARHGLGDNEETSKHRNNQIRNAQQFAENQQLKHPETDDEIRPWVEGFIDSDSVDDETKKILLQNIGKLDKKSWRAFEGDPKQDRCALLFFGLPRAFQTMVLPSIIQNILVPNARHHCDVYVHFYRQYEEAPGRRNRGGRVDPDEIFLLEDAVRSVYRQHGPKLGSRTDHGRLEPIVSFTHDTSEQFLKRREEQLGRYQNALGIDGKPLYFPWAAKTYTATALENMVRQWHSVEYVFKLMDFTALQSGISYSRVGMFRSDAFYMTPIDIASVDTQQAIMDTRNRFFVTAPFALYPVNDRMVYGPYEAVKVWATKRFDLVEERANQQSEPGYTMHSERFMNASIFVAMKQLGYQQATNPDICFSRTRADESTIVSDCSMAGTARNWKIGNSLALVESIVGKKCKPFQMGSKWKFVGCGDNHDYESGKEIGWL
jgi:hypothetical protein